MQPAGPTSPVMLENQVRNYAWGSKTAIQKILGLEPDLQTPWAELWMGAHPGAPSRVFVNGQWIRLDEWIRSNPEDALGKAPAEAFGNTLPYLFKVLAADQPLSIQAHPDRELARLGFEKENSSGIPADAPERNYRDPRAKPELIFAVEPFSALIGFRKPAEITDMLARICPQTLGPEIKALEKRPEKTGIRDFFHSLMTMDKDRRRKITGEAVIRAEKMDSPEAAWIRRLCGFYPDDPGILAPAFLNLTTIEPGEAVFLEPGVLHAYLSGVGMEIMANSDNVVRGGLTKKSIDTQQLLCVVKFSPGAPNLIKPRQTGDFEKIYPTEAKEFIFSEIRIDRGCVWQGPDMHSAEILFCMHGKAQVSAHGENSSLEIKKGQAVFVPAAAGKYQAAGRAVLYRAGVPS
ncbi:MAG: mannose-6-phosphate isomerase, class I [Desulfobacterales bacterium]